MCLVCFDVKSAKCCKIVAVNIYELHYRTWRGYHSFFAYVCYTHGPFSRFAQNYNNETIEKTARLLFVSNMIKMSKTISFVCVKNGKDDKNKGQIM